MKKLLFLLFLLPNLVMAEPKSIKLEPFWDEEYYSKLKEEIIMNNVDCKNAMTTVDMISCGLVEIEEKYKTNYKYYKKVISVVSNDVAEQIYKAYESGVSYRNSFCGAAIRNTLGTRRGTLYQHCILVLTKANTHFLWDQFLTNMAGEAEFSDFPEPKATYNLYK